MRRFLTISGAVIGAWFGASIGIAAFGTAINGSVPFFFIGGIIGFLATPDLSRLFQKTSKKKDNAHRTGKQGPTR